MTILERLGAGLKSLTAVIFPRASGWWGGNWGGNGTTHVNYASIVGDGTTSSVVMAPVRWAMRNYVEAPLQVVERDRDNQLKVLPGHPLTTLLEKPNPAYNGPLLWMSALADSMLTGNGYILKVRAGGNKPVQLWWTPSALLTPVASDSDGTVWIDHYAYTPRGVPIRVEPADVIHLRPFGLDPANPRLGWSPLGALMAEVWGDLEAAAFAGSILRNLGVPGVVLSPSGDLAMQQDDADRAKVAFEQKFGGDNRGRTFVATRGLKADVVSWSPEQLNLDKLRRLPEARVAGVFGIPPIVVGFQVGLEHGTFSNYGQAREAAYEEFLIPMHRLNDADLTTQLLPDFDTAANHFVRHDYSDVRVLQDDRDKLFAREALALRAGGVTVNEFRSSLGKPEIPQGNVFFLSGTVKVVAADQLDAPAEPVPVPLRALPEAAGLQSAETKAAPDLGIFTPEALAAAERFGEDVGLGGLLAAVPAKTNGTH